MVRRLSWQNFHISKACDRTSKVGLDISTLSLEVHGFYTGLNSDVPSLIKLVKNISLFEYMAPHPLFGKKHSQPPLFRLLFLSFSYLETVRSVPCSDASHMHPYVNPATAVCVRWRPQMLVKSLYPLTLGQYRFLFLIQEKLKLNITPPWRILKWVLY